MKYHFLWALIVLAIFTGTVHAQEPLYGCRMTYDSSNHEDFNINIYEPVDVLAVYEYRNQHFVLRDTHTREILKVLEANLLVDSFGDTWSPDCHYIIGAYNDTFTIWDSQTGARVGDGAPTGRIFWNTVNHHYAVVDTWDFTYLWHVPSNTQIVLNLAEGLRKYGDIHRVGWDNQRGQVFVVQGGSGHIVHVYDMNGGQLITTLQTLSEAAPVNFKLSPDGSHIAVFTSDKERWEYVSLIGYYRPSRVSVFNRDN